MTVDGAPWTSAWAYRSPSFRCFFTSWSLVRASRPPRIRNSSDEIVHRYASNHIAFVDLIRGRFATLMAFACAASMSAVVVAIASSTRWALANASLRRSLRDAPFQFRRNVFRRRGFRLRDGQVVGKRPVEGGEPPPLEVAVLDELDGRGIDGVSLPEDDCRTAFLIDRYCDVVQRGVECVHLGIADIFHLRLFVDARSETQFLRVGPAEIQDAGEDAHDLAFRAAKRARERVAVESERIDSRTGK